VPVGVNKNCLQVFSVLKVEVHFNHLLHISFLISFQLFEDNSQLTVPRQATEAR